MPKTNKRRRRGSKMSKPKCCLCGTSNEDPLNLGEMKSCRGYTAHYYCLLLSSTITQTGEDNEGILGFLPSDICEELKRSKIRMCSYCKKRGASVLCNTKNCKVVFHLPCGIKHCSGHQFYGSFSSNCVAHRPKQKFMKPKDPQACPICYESINFGKWTEVLWAPCCKKQSYFHKQCLQQMALSAGYFFKCPMCNNTDIFQKTMKHFGVFIPDRDASWELVPNAFQELLYRHDECNAEVCECFKGKKYSNNGPWEIILCSSCGSQGTHASCSKLRKGQSWHCRDCTASLSAPQAPTNSQESSVAVQPAVVDISRPSTSRESPPSTSSANIVSLPQSKASVSNQSRKRKRRSSDIPDKKGMETPSTSRTPSISSETPMIEIDSDSDVVVIEEDEPAVKCLLAQDGSVLPVRNISTQDKNFSVQGDLNIEEERERPKRADTLMNLVISDVRSLKDTTPTNSKSEKDKKVIEALPVRNQSRNNFVMYPPVADPKNGSVSVIDSVGNVYILKEILGYQLYQNRRIIGDQNNQSVGNFNNNQENDIVVID